MALNEHSMDSTLYFYNFVGLPMDSFKKERIEILSFFLPCHSLAYITHNVTQLPRVWSEIQVCYASSG